MLALHDNPKKHYAEKFPWLSCLGATGLKSAAKGLVRGLKYNAFRAVVAVWSPPPLLLPPPFHLVVWIFSVVVPFILLLLKKVIPPQHLAAEIDKNLVDVFCEPKMSAEPCPAPKTFRRHERPPSDILLVLALAS